MSTVKAQNGITVASVEGDGDSPHFNTIVRVKRKRTDMPVAPEFLVFPRAVDKRVRVGGEAFSRLTIGGATDVGTSSCADRSPEGCPAGDQTQGATAATDADTDADAVVGPQGVVCALVETDDAGLFFKGQSDASDKLMAKIKTRMSDYYENRYLRAAVPTSNGNANETATLSAEDTAREQRFNNAQQRNRQQRAQVLQERRQLSGIENKQDTLWSMFSVVDVDLTEATKPKERASRHAYRYPMQHRSRGNTAAVDVPETVGGMASELGEAGVLGLGFTGRTPHISAGTISMNGKPMTRKLQQPNAASCMQQVACGDGIHAPQETNLEMDKAVWYAFNHGEFDRLMSLMARGYDPNFQRQADGIVPLMAACRHGRQDIVGHLLANGARVDAIDTFGNSVLDHIDLSPTLLSMNSTDEATGAGASAIALRQTLNNHLLYHQNFNVTDPSPVSAATEYPPVAQSPAAIDVPGDNEDHSSAELEPEGEYVYDIYCVQSPLTANDPRLGSNQSNHMGHSGMDGGAENSNTMRTIIMDPLRMSMQATQLFDSVGLDHLSSELELVNDVMDENDQEEEDSEDSNSERFAGNSYPDEDEFSDQEGQEFGYADSNSEDGEGNEGGSEGGEFY